MAVCYEVSILKIGKWKIREYRGGVHVRNMEYTIWEKEMLVPSEK